MTEMYPKNGKQGYEATKTKELACYAERLFAIFRNSSMITNIPLHYNCRQGLVEFESFGHWCQRIPVRSAVKATRLYYPI